MIQIHVDAIKVEGDWAYRCFPGMLDNSLGDDQVRFVKRYIERTGLTVEDFSKLVKTGILEEMDGVFANWEIKMKEKLKEES